MTARNANTGVWVARHATSGNALVFRSEMAALRYGANADGVTVRFIEWGTSVFRNDDDTTPATDTITADD